jgi:hypothetical protein
LFPFFSGDTSLVKDIQEKAPAYVTSVLVWYPDSQPVPSHKLMVAAGIWTFKAKLPEVAYKVRSANRAYRWHVGLALY